MTRKHYPVTVWAPSGAQSQLDWLAEEVPVALVYNGISHVVMMCTPQDLEAFAMGFSLSEGIISSPQQIYGISVVPQTTGIEVHIELSSRCFVALKQRRRSLAGRTGCGICGTEQLSMLQRPEHILPVSQQFSLFHLESALQQLSQFQPIGQQTAATHLAAWVTDAGDIVSGFEDIGRHVALDKLLGARASAQWGTTGCVFISSRASYEIVQKAVTCQVEILCAASAATALAVDLADQYGLTLVGFSRARRAVIYTHAHRLCC